MRFTFLLLTVSLLVHSSLVASECRWDPSVDVNQDLDPVSLKAGALNLGRLTDVGPEKCQEACCSLPDCDLALVGLPADGEPQCQLVKCLSQDRDLCVLRPSTQFKVYRKKATASRTAEGHKLHVVPLDVGVQKTNETNNFRCRLPMKVGSCRAAFSRFFYNVTSGSCSSFTFGGCEANGNNFYSRDECEAACSGVTGSVLPIDSTPAPPVKAPRMAPPFNAEPSEDEVRPADSESAASEAVPAEHCGEVPQPGPCRAAFKRWFFNKKTGNCETFIYGGCRGNNNNYLSEKSCRETCSGTVLPSSKKSPADEYTPEYRDQCVVTPDPGRCRAAFPKFYFDYSSGTCRSFVYGGCGGNRNRYDTENECTSRCSGEGAFDSRGKTRDRKTAAIFLFITLAAISALVLVTLVIISLRRHRLTRRPSSISDKEELLPDEQCSVDSLTMPDSPKPDKP